MALKTAVFNLWAQDNYFICIYRLSQSFVRLRLESTLIQLHSMLRAVAAATLIGAHSETTSQLKLAY